MRLVVAVLVALAGAGGVLLRYGVSSAVHGEALPWVTVAINVVGSFLLGMLVVAHWASPQTRTVLGVGFLGGFTTFSTFSSQAFLDVRAGEAGKAGRSGRLAASTTASWTSSLSLTWLGRARRPSRRRGARVQASAPLHLTSRHQRRQGNSPRNGRRVVAAWEAAVAAAPVAGGG